MSRLQDCWPTGRDFLEAVERYWGRPYYQLSADRTLALVRCPGCRPPSRDWHDWSLMIARQGDGWEHTAWCGCSDHFIAAELVENDRARFERRLGALLPYVGRRRVADENRAALREELSWK